MKSLKIITAFFALATAIMLSLWVLDLVNDESTKDAIIKLAALSGIAAALSAVMQLFNRS